MQRFYHIALVLTIVAGFSGCSDKAEAPPPAKAVEAPPPPPALTPDVTIDSGKLSGDSDAASGVKIFRGIPFAAAPVGDLRWRAPAPVAPWTEVRAATTFGSPCPQPGTLAVMMGGTLPPTSEDCLSLNVWTPAATAADKLPVMVWIHGGGLSLGWSSQGAYDGIELAKRGVVFVSINYRLGPLGFLALPALSEESGNNASGNYGFLDQVAALQWVQRNIARFGGDPKQVTIFGESAGGTSVFALLASPTTEGLFQRAIAQSPWVTDTNIAALKTPGKIVGSAEAMGTQWAETIVGAGGDTSLANLRSIPAVDMIGDQKPQLPMFITVDGQFMPANGEEIFRTGAQRQVPMIVGTNADEGTLFMMGGYNNRKGRIRRVCGRGAGAIPGGR
jgi:para-nitrobenzyl esterase